MKQNLGLQGLIRMTHLVASYDNPEELRTYSSKSSQWIFSWII